MGSSLFSSLTDTMSDISSTTNQITSTGKSVNSLLGTGNKLVNTVTGGGTTKSSSKTASSNGKMISPGTTNLVAPKGTCIIVPAEVSLTGQPRFIGKNAYMGLSTIINGGESNHLEDVLIVDENMQPSASIYDQSSTGELFIKGTKTPVNIKKNGDGQYQAVIISEKEFSSIVKGMATQGSGKFKVSDEGDAEDVDNRSWLSRNWEWLVGAFVAIGGVLATLLMIRKQKKAEKSAKNQSATLSEKVTTLQTEIEQVKANALETASSTQTDTSTLASNSTPVNVSDTAVTTSTGRDYA